MKLKFAKYQATGNDFIIIHNSEDQHYIYSPVVTRQLCHRQFGIGADGLITIEQKADYDFYMLHYNADGSRGGGLCGNGSRAALHYAQQLGLMTQKARFLAIDGLHAGHVADTNIHVSLQDVTLIQPMHQGYFLDNGTRHYIEVVDDVREIDMSLVGFSRRKMTPFEKEGVNLNFVQLTQGNLLLRTCECGLETEPLSCGTGAVASALVSSAYYGSQSPVEVVTQGGTLWVSFTKLSNGHFTDIHLIGCVEQTFHGVVDLHGLIGNETPM